MNNEKRATTVEKTCNIMKKAIDWKRVFMLKLIYTISPP